MSLALDHEQLGARDPGGQQSRVRGRDDPILVSMPDRGWLADGGQIHAPRLRKGDLVVDPAVDAGPKRLLNIAEEVRGGLSV